MNDPVSAAFRCVLALTAVIAVGTLGFVVLENDWTVWQALFFTLITITTVGYGDEGVSRSGEVFAAFLLLGGIGTATYTLTTLVQMAVGYQSDWKRIMQKEIDRLTGHYLICGFGRMGQTVSDELHAADIPFVVIDSDRDAYELATERGYLALCGNSSDDEIIDQAGIRRAAGIICVCGADSDNLLVTLIAAK